MNKIQIDKKLIVIEDNQEKVIYSFDCCDVDITYKLKRNSKLVVYQYGININNNIVVNLDGENASVEYHYSTINYSDHKFKIDINHNSRNTISNIYNHGVNVLNNMLNFDVNGKVINTSDNCICNQENQIINLSDGNSIILPNLLIDNYNVSSSHSAYIGKFKEKTVFYLMSRGISKSKSYELLIRSFLVNSLEGENEELNKLYKEIEKIWR